MRVSIDPLCELRRLRRDILQAERKLAEPITIAKFWKNRRRSESVHVTLSEYEGHALVSVRIYVTGADGCDRPTPKGVSISVRKLPELAAGLAKGLERAKALGLLDLAEPSE